MGSDEYLLVKEVHVLTLASKDGEVKRSSPPFLRFILENGSDFTMSNIPHDIAVAISMHLGKIDTQDSRLRIVDLVGQLALVHKVEIDSVVPGTSVYQATVSLTPEGFSNPLHFPMIPSHSVLIAILNDAPIYISNDLWTEYMVQATEFIDVDDDDEREDW